VENVEKHDLCERSAKKMCSKCVEEKRKHPHPTPLIHRPQKCSAFHAYLYVDKRKPSSDFCGKKARLFGKMNFYTVYTWVYNSVYPHFSRDVDEFPQILSTGKRGSKKRRIRRVLSQCSEKEANKVPSYPQIVQYLWITVHFLCDIMFPLPYSHNKGGKCRDEQRDCA